MSNRTFTLLGWALFLMSAFTFVVSSLLNGDVASLVGSIFFFIACIVSMIPVLRCKSE